MLVGKDLGPYHVDKELGSGAMGTVYRAKHKTNGERVAVKLMSPALGTSEQARLRFIRELDILKQLNHPNIVRYKGSGRYHGSPFFIMEYVEGDSLDHVMARRDRLTWEEIVDLGTQLCSALQHSHDKGIIHRDLKPSNVMVLRDGTVKLTDFGIAKDTDVTALTAANSTVGTAAYMSPEQCRGSRNITFKSDLYSLGVMLYELLTGRKPFTADTAMDMFLKHSKEPFAPPSQWVIECPPWLNTIICQLMEKKPEQRPQSAAMVGMALQSVKEKMAAQQSAAEDTARKRRVDRTSTDVPLDDTDKDAARALLGKKKRKKKAQPFYTRGWFTIAALGTIAVTAVVVIYFAFLRTASAESMFAEAQALMKSASEERREEARKGPIADFLRLYPDHEKAPQMQAWADQVDCEIRERQMFNRRNLKMRADSEAETDARLALDNEELGKLDIAARLWNNLAKLKDDKDPSERAWGLVGEKYAKDLQEVARTYDGLKVDLQSERILNKKHEPKSASEEQAMRAVREEAAGEWENARDEWELLKNRSKGDPDERRWYLLAIKQLRELGDK